MASHFALLQVSFGHFFFARFLSSTVALARTEAAWDVVSHSKVCIVQDLKAVESWENTQLSS